DTPLDLTRRLLGANEDDTEASAPLRDVEHDFLDRAASFTWGVLVQLIEDEEYKRVAPARGSCFVFHKASDHDAHDEVLRTIIQLIYVNNVDLMFRPFESM